MSNKRHKSSSLSSSLVNFSFFEHIPTSLILYQIAPYIDFAKLARFSRLNKQFHKLFKFPLVKRFHWNTSPENPLKFYFSRITWIKVLKCMYWDVIDKMQHFKNIKTLDITNYWTSKDTMFFTSFTGTLITSMHYSNRQVWKQLRTFPTTSELIVIGNNTPMNSTFRFNNKNNFITRLFERQLPQSIKQLKILAREPQGVVLFSPTKPGGLIQFQEKLQTLEFDYVIDYPNRYAFSFAFSIAFPAVTQIVDSKHIYTKTETGWYYSTLESPTDIHSISDL